MDFGNNGAKEPAESCFVSRFSVNINVSKYNFHISQNNFIIKMFSLVAI